MSRYSMKYSVSVLILSFSLFFFSACGVTFPHTAIVLIKSTSQLNMVNASGNKTQTTFELSDVYLKGNDVTSKKKAIKKEYFIPFGITWYGESPTLFQVYGKLNATTIFDDTVKHILDIGSLQSGNKIYITITEVEINTSTNAIAFKTTIERL